MSERCIGIERNRESREIVGEKEENDNNIRELNKTLKKGERGCSCDETNDTLYNVLRNDM